MAKRGGFYDGLAFYNTLRGLGCDDIAKRYEGVESVSSKDVKGVIKYLQREEGKGFNEKAFVQGLKPYKGPKTFEDEKNFKISLRQLNLGLEKAYGGRKYWKVDLDENGEIEIYSMEENKPTGRIKDKLPHDKEKGKYFNKNELNTVLNSIMEYDHSLNAKDLYQKVRETTERTSGLERAVRVASIFTLFAAMLSLISLRATGFVVSDSSSPTNFLNLALIFGSMLAIYKIAKRK